MKLSEVKRELTLATPEDVASMPGAASLGTLATAYDVIGRRVALAANPLVAARTTSVDVASLVATRAALRLELERRGVVIET